MPRPRDENKVLLIHAAALKLVIKTGFSSLKMADVAKEAGIATGTLYIYYKSSEDLINDLYVVTKKEIAEVMLSPENQEDTLYGSFKKMWLAYFFFCYKNPEKMLFTEQFLYSGLISETNKALTDSFFEPLNQFLEAAKKQSFIKDLDVELLKAHMHGALHEIVKLLIKSGQRPEAFPIHSMFELTWNGVRL